MGFKSGVFNTAVTASCFIVGAVLLEPLLVGSIAIGIGYGLAGIGSLGLGYSITAGITGRGLFGNRLSEYEQGEYLGGSLVGMGLLGVGAWEQFWQSGKLFGIKNIELKTDKESIRTVGDIITGYTKHGLN